MEARPDGSWGTEIAITTSLVRSRVITMFAMAVAKDESGLVLDVIEPDIKMCESWACGLYELWKVALFTFVIE